MPTLRILKYKYAADSMPGVDGKKWQKEVHQEEAQNNVPLLLRGNNSSNNLFHQEVASSSIISNNQNAITATHTNIPSTPRVAATCMATCNSSLAHQQQAAAESYRVIRPNDGEPVEPMYDQNYDVHKSTTAYYNDADADADADADTDADADSVISDDKRELIDADISLEPTSCFYNFSSSIAATTSRDEKIEPIFPPCHDAPIDIGQSDSTYSNGCGKEKDNILKGGKEQIECQERRRNPAETAASDERQEVGRERTSFAFDKRFDELMAFKKKHNHCNVPKSKSGGYYSLSQWCCNLRLSYKQMKKNQKPTIPLSDEKIRRLTEAGFDWRLKNLTKPTRTSFDERFDALMAFKKEHNHCNVPGSKSGEYCSLGKWCRNLRCSYNKIQQNQTPYISLSDEKIRRLTEAGFEWDLRGMKILTKFNEGFDALMAYKKEHNHCNVPTTKSGGYYSLGQWCCRLRLSYKQMKKNQKPTIPLSDEKIQRLTEAGFDWRVQNWTKPTRTSFDERFDELMAYKKEHNHCNVPGSKSGGYYSLGKWCRHLRYSYRKIKQNQKSPLSLSDEKIQRLTEAGFDWRVQKLTTITSFDERFDALMAFKKEHNHCNVPRSKFGPYPSLGQWCYNLKYSYKKIQQNQTPYISLSDEKIQRLTEAGFEWDLRGKKT